MPTIDCTQNKTLTSSFQNLDEMIDLALVCVGGEILCGIYRDYMLIDEIRSDELPLVALPRMFSAFFLPSSPKVRAIYYAKGPGSFTSLKLVHIFLHTLREVHGFELFATSSFYFSNKGYIKAFGSTYFTQNTQGEILLTQKEHIKELDSQTDFIPDFSLPKVLDTTAFDKDTSPLYILPAV